MNKKIATLFKALSDTSRMKIFHSLVIASTALSITQISTEFNMSRQGVTKHIKILEEAKLIKISNKGRERFCKANPGKLKEVKKWLAFYDKFWDDSLSRLSDYMNEKSA